ncbi:hypothetical protein [Streptomyces sp. NPDC050759]|uniref:hypothetical protein n=1 Tax=Streptomyces sp. NPDC050759 TaxID=3365635 RepID=UPI00378D0EAD
MTGHPKTASTRCSTDCSFSDIVEAAGVVRRTVYDHFVGRSVLVDGLVADAAEARRHNLTAVTVPGPDAPPDATPAMARFTLAMWPVDDR